MNHAGYRSEAQRNSGSSLTKNDRVQSSIGGLHPVPSPPSSGERVRGPNGRETLGFANQTEGIGFFDSCRKQEPPSP